MVEVVYLPKKGSNMPEKVSIRWDGVDYSLSVKKPIDMEKEIAKAILGDWEKEGILLSAEIARVKAKIAPSTPLHQIFVVVDGNYRNIFEKEKISFEEQKDVFEEQKNILNILIEQKDILIEQKNILEEEKNVVKEHKSILEEARNIVKEHKSILEEKRKVVEECKSIHRGLWGGFEEPTVYPPGP